MVVLAIAGVFGGGGGAGDSPSKDEGLLDWPANSLKWLARKAVEPLMLLR